MFAINKHTFFPVEPQSALRSVRTQLWLTGVTEEEALRLELEFKHDIDKKQTHVGAHTRQHRRHPPPPGRRDR